MAEKMVLTCKQCAQKRVVWVRLPDRPPKICHACQDANIRAGLEVKR